MNNCLECNLKRILYLSHFKKFFVKFGKNLIRVNYSGKIDLNWVKKYLMPYYNFSETNKTKYDWEIFLINNEIFFQEIKFFCEKKLKKKNNNKDIQYIIKDDDSILLIQNITEEGEKKYSYVYINLLNNKIYLICKEYNQEINYLLVRYIRSLNNLYSLLQGDVQLHASGVEYKKKGVLFIGNKNQGKTIGMLNSCIYGNFNYISNDHIFIQPKNGLVFGSPTSVGIRKDTLKYFKIFSDYLRGRKKPKYIYQANTEPHEDKMYFLVQELIAIINSKIKENIKLKIIIIPFYDPKINYVEVEKVGNVFNIVNDLIINNPCEQQPFWYNNYKNELQKIHKQQKEKLLKIIKNIPVYKISYNEKLREEFTLEIKRLIDESEDYKYLYEKAQKFIIIHHANSKRKDLKPLINHLFLTKNILSKNGYNNSYILTLALLHDIIEESNVKKDLILNNFGKQLYNDIESLTIIKKKDEAYDSQINRMKKKLLSASNEALIVKCADRLHNLMNMQDEKEFFRIDKITRYKQATKEIFNEVIIPKLGEKNKIINESFKIIEKED